MNSMGGRFEAQLRAQALRRARGSSVLIAAAALLFGCAPGAFAKTPRRPKPMSAKAVVRLLAPALQSERRGDFDRAALLAQAQVAAHPNEPLLASAVAAIVQEAALRHLRRGEDEQARGQLAAAAVEYRAALALAPQDDAARRGLESALGSSAPPAAAADAVALRVRRAAPPIQLLYDPGKHDISFKGDAHVLIGTVAAAFGLRAYVANDVPNRPVQLVIGKSTFAQAMSAVASMLGIAWRPLDARTIYVGRASEARAFEPMAVRTFYLPGSASANETTEMAQLLRVMLAPHQVVADLAHNALTVRARPEKLDQAEQLLLDLAQPPGQVMFAVRIVTADDSTLRQLGVSVPNQLQAIPLAPILAQLAQGANESQLIDQLFNQGGLNALLGSGALQQALGQLQLSPLLSTPFAVFGGGLTAMALTIPPAALNLSLTRATSQQLEQAWLGAAAGQPATLKIGERFPIVNATFSPILLNSAIAKVIGNGSFQQPFPSITYEDLGLNLELTPWLDGPKAVTVKVNAQEEALAGAGVNGIPVLASRKLTTLLRLRDGEPAIIAGLRSTSDSQGRTAVPILGAIPLLGPALSTHELNRSYDDILVVITPHIVREPARDTMAIWLPPGEFSLGLSPYFPRSGLSD